MTFELHLPVDSQNSLPVEALNLIVKSKSLPVEESNSTIEFHLPVDSQYSSPVVALSAGQTIATCQRNISQHVVFVWPPCCDVLQHVGCCWLKFENGQIWANNNQHVVTCRNTVAKHTVAPNSVAIC